MSLRILIPSPTETVNPKYYNRLSRSKLKSFDWSDVNPPYGNPPYTKSPCVGDGRCLLYLHETRRNEPVGVIASLLTCVPCLRNIFHMVFRPDETDIYPELKEDTLEYIEKVHLLREEMGVDTPEEDTHNNMCTCKNCFSFFVPSTYEEKTNYDLAGKLRNKHFK